MKNIVYDFYRTQRITEAIMEDMLFKDVLINLDEEKNMPAPICVNCQVPFIVDKIGGPVIEMFLNPPEPYKVWSTDILKCPGCGAKIAHGYGKGPLETHKDEGMERLLKAIKNDESTVKAYERLSQVPEKEED